MRKIRDYDLAIGITLTSLTMLLMIVGFFYTPYNSEAINHLQVFHQPSLSHPFGTDNFGRDILSRVMIGARYTMLVAVCTVFFSTISGIVLGLISGYLGGVIDEVVMRIIDALMSFPSILLALMLITVLGQGLGPLILALGIIFIPSFSRIVRSCTLQYKEQEFIKSGKVMGASSLRLMFVHILPNVYPTLLSAVTIGFSNAILAEAGMSFLGFGIQPPIPSWGRMLFESQTFLFNAAWCAIFPGIAIMITVLGFNFLGEALRKVI